MRKSWKLTPLQKHDLVMLYLTGMSGEELASKFSISVQTVYKLLNRRIDIDAAQKDLRRKQLEERISASRSRDAQK